MPCAGEILLSNVKRMRRGPSAGAYAARAEDSIEQSRVELANLYGIHDDPNPLKLIDGDLYGRDRTIA